MITHVAYLPGGASPYLLECWLRTLPVDARVALLIAPSPGGSITEDGATLRGVDQVHQVRDDAPLPDALRDAVQGNGLVRIHVPFSVERVPLRYRVGALMPAVAPHYALLRRLWQWGFRAVVFVDHGGETILALPHLLDEFHHRHRGRRCFVVGNGPSLNQIDMAKLQGEITLGSNRCFLGYPQWGFPFTYWGVYDAFQIEEYHPIYEANVPAETVKLFPMEYSPVLRVEQGCAVNSVWPDPHPRAFSDDPARVYRGFTVTYMLLQIAAIMGCDPIILIGADHRYELTHRGYSRILRGARRGIARRLRGGRLYETALAAQRAWRRSASAAEPTLWTTADATSPTHFTAGYTDGGKNRFLPPEPEEAERDFECARQWAEASGRQILNATPGSALECFPKVEFEGLF